MHNGIFKTALIYGVNILSRKLQTHGAHFGFVSRE